jgi:hypothetical protein
MTRRECDRTQPTGASGRDSIISPRPWVRRSEREAATCGKDAQARAIEKINLPALMAFAVLPHIKRLDDCFGQFLVRVICDCGTCREIEPEALARRVGWSVTLKDLAPRLRCSQCGKKTAMTPSLDQVREILE